MKFPESAKRLMLKVFFGVADGARTHDNRNHNPGLYQLSYSHH
ncbi:UDP-2,3-diacylglucosamine hydrolase [Paraburkholderia dioscoreae]|uniref:UDP-2,3-diacylglucosamine hydrolase n=1 Tax=Paraburkholderia dioscoreae TaxID=2604047 RepID=A0A5Q4Z200_9BURK|nr:UDP-2,3-diacylglucosamine hydrolase [Paraburkholderia dioscoreae]